FGNSLVRKLINFFFGENLKDIMSGYRVFTRGFIKNYPMLVQGFEIETDITIQALQRNFRIVEIPITYKDRPILSPSKLNTFSDGFLVLKRIFIIFKNYKPFFFFSLCAVFFFILSIISGTPVIIEFLKIRYVTHVPLAILSTGLMLLAGLSFFAGIILDGIVYMFREISEILHINSKTK
ncbi:glycosyl transferase, partial [bacterium]